MQYGNTFDEHFERDRLESGHAPFIEEAKTFQVSRSQTFTNKRDTRRSQFPRGAKVKRTAERAAALVTQTSPPSAQYTERERTKANGANKRSSLWAHSLACRSLSIACQCPIYRALRLTSPGTSFNWQTFCQRCRFSFSL